MKVSLLLLLFLLLATAISFEIQPQSTALSAVPNDNSYIWLLRRSIMKGAPYIGFYVNRTVYAFPNLAPLAGVCLPGEAATQLYFEIFDLIPMVTGKLDEGAFLVKVPPASTLYLINPDLGNKWMMWNTSHIYQFGIDESKALIVNDEFLNRYPTEYIF
jgi:hypothetical protein